MRGVDAMVIAYLRDNPKSNMNQVAIGTGCTPVSVRGALYSLMKAGKISGERMGVRNYLAYSLKANVDLAEMDFDNLSTVADVIPTAQLYFALYNDSAAERKLMLALY